MDPKLLEEMERRAKIQAPKDEEMRQLGYERELSGALPPTQRRLQRLAEAYRKAAEEQEGSRARVCSVSPTRTEDASGELEGDGS